MDHVCQQALAHTKDDTAHLHQSHVLCGFSTTGASHLTASQPAHTFAADFHTPHPTGTSAAVQHLLWLRNQSALQSSSSDYVAAQTFTAESSRLGASDGAAAHSSVALGVSRRIGMGAARLSGAAQGGGLRLGYEARMAPAGAGGRGREVAQGGRNDQQRPLPLLDQLRQSDKHEVEMVGAARRHERSGVTQQGRVGEGDGKQEERAWGLQQQQRPLVLQQGEGDLAEGERDADGAEQAAKVQVLQQPTLERQSEGGHDVGEREAEKARVLQQLRGRRDAVWSAEQLRGYEPCVEDYGEAYLNMPEVRGPRCTARCTAQVERSCLARAPR